MRSGCCSSPRSASRRIASRRKSGTPSVRAKSSDGEVGRRAAGRSPARAARATSRREKAAQRELDAVSAAGAAARACGATDAPRSRVLVAHAWRPRGCGGSPTSSARCSSRRSEAGPAHCRSSSTISSGQRRLARASVRATASKKQEAALLGPASLAPAARGAARASSGTRSASSPAPPPARAAPRRPASSARELAQHLREEPERGHALAVARAPDQHARRRAAPTSAANTSTSRVLPMPGGPVTSATPPRPAGAPREARRAARRARRRARRSVAAGARRALPAPAPAARPASSARTSPTKR